MTWRMTRLYMAARNHLQDRLLARRHDERGQGTLEYVGIAVLIGLIMVAIFGLKLQDTLSKAVSDAVAKITGGK